MQVLIPFAFCSSEACRQALHAFKLPHLKKLLRRLTPAPLDVGTELSLSPPHERALARSLGLPVVDGLIPWAAWQARCAHRSPSPAGKGAEKIQPALPIAESIPDNDSGWAFITPCHWQAGARHVAMGAAELADFSAAESQTLLAAMQPYFAEDGVTLYYERPTRWLACADIFRSLATASLDRVAGRSVANWLPSVSSALPLQRLQSEMQMLLYEHPVNDAREARGVPTVNSFWISGTGPQPCPVPAGAGANSGQIQVKEDTTISHPLVPEGVNRPTVITTLRAAALAEDWLAWAAAWQALDDAEGVAMLAALARGKPLQLTLCGERNAQTFHASPQGYLTRLMNLFGGQSATAILEQL